MSPSRPSIPREIRDRLLVSCKHRCCICDRGWVQIHHIDGDPTNNSEDNLIPLCRNHAGMVHMLARARELWIKNAVEGVASISEIEEHERPKLLKELPSITAEKLDESIRFLAYEVIKVNIVNHKAVAILQNEEKTTVKII